MAKKQSTFSTRQALSKANSNTIAMVSIAIAISVFSLVSAKALASKFSYQHKVLHARRLALATLKQDKTAADDLTNQYSSIFENSNPINIIGGKNDKSAVLPPDGDNARIVIDSLPTTYDYPALISSVSYILSNNHILNQSITGTDQSSANSNKPTARPTPIAITLTVIGQGSYAQLQTLVHDFERSTRPFDITDMQVTGNAKAMTFNLQVTTYYQPARTFMTDTKEVK